MSSLLPLGHSRAFQNFPANLYVLAPLPPQPESVRREAGLLFALQPLGGSVTHSPTRRPGAQTRGPEFPKDLF